MGEISKFPDRETKIEQSGENGEKEKGADNTVRMKVEVLDKLMMLAGELVLVRNQQMQNLDHTDANTRTIAKRLDLVTTELQENIMRTRMQPIGNLFSKYNRIVRDLGKKLGKQIEISTMGDDVELDRTIMETLSDPLTHLVRNSCDHGIETPEDRKKAGKSARGRLELLAYHEGGQILIKIQDDGKGINPEKVKETARRANLKTDEELSRLSDKEILQLVFLPGFSTTEKISDVSGRGVGMDVVKTSVESQGGTVELSSMAGQGTELSMRLPLTLAIIPSLIVTVGQSRFAIPQVNIEEIVSLYDDDILDKIECAGHEEVYRLRNTLLPLVRLEEILNRREVITDDVKAQITHTYRQKAIAQRENSTTKRLHESLSFVVIKQGAYRFGVIVTNVIGTEEIVVTPMHVTVKDLAIYAGAAVMGDGEVALIIDAFGISRHARLNFSRQEADRNVINLDREKKKTNENSEILLFSYGPNERFGLELSQIRRIEHLDMKKVEKVGQKSFITLDGVSTLILHLDKYLDVSQGKIGEEMFFLLSKDIKYPHGILVSTLLDIGSYDYKLDTETHQEVGLAGTAIIEEHMTLMIDLKELVKKAEPEWVFEEKQIEKEWAGPRPDPDIPGLLWA